MSCKAKSCKYFKKCVAKRDCMDSRCGDYEKDNNFVPSYSRKPTPFERTKAAVYATGNKCAIENFEATH